MTRKHRAIHRVLWPVLLILVGMGFAAALLLRPPVPVQNSAVQGEIWG